MEGKSVIYYLIRDRIVAKQEENGERIEGYLFRDGKWVEDVNNVIMDHLMGYDPSEPEDSPYRFGSTSILMEIDEISEKDAMLLINQQVLDISKSSGKI